MAAEKVERPALGSIAHIGDLYDARSDNFLGVSIFKEVPQDSLSLSNSHSFSINIINGDEYSKKLSKLDVKGDLQVAVLADMIPLEGSSSYILDRKTSARTLKSSLIYQIKTNDQGLNFNHKDLMPFLSTQHIESMVATHVVTGISWGVNAILSLSFESSGNEKDAKKIKEKLAVTLQKVLSTLSTNTFVDLSEHESSKADPFQIKMYGGLLTNSRDNLQTAVKYMKKLPDLARELKWSKRQILTYHLTPLNVFMSNFSLPVKTNVTYKALESSTVNQIVQLFDLFASTQQHLSDISQDFKQFWYCVAENEKQFATTLLENIEVEETSCKTYLSSALPAIRSEKSDVVELEKLEKEIKICKHYFQKIKAFLDALKPLLEKINFARQIVSGGAKYVGFGASLDIELSQIFEKQIFVIYFTEIGTVADGTVRWKENKQLFLQHLKDKPENTHFIAVDCDFHPIFMPKAYKSSSCIQVQQSGNIIIEDLFEENSKLQIIPRAQATQKPEKFVSFPNKRVPLAIPCIGTFCDSQQIYNWTCKTCGESLLYGFDLHVYCPCGKLPASSLEFKCPDVKHGAKFQMHTDPKHLNHFLEQLQPNKEINILIMGETGVGKSTWINGFINYLTYDSIEEAQRGELLTLIPSEFTVCNPTDEGFDQIVVRTGQDKNEVFQTGQSATQTTKVYPFRMGNDTVQLIDTPGIGDARGIEQDKKNFQNILSTLSHLQEIHGICILLKPNSARLTVMFRFCIKELLMYLHRGASKNIVFCFTNSRSTFYKPGDTLPGLTALLKENKDVEIVVNPKTVYCYDSEAYRFLAAVQNDPPVVFEEGEKENFAKSWERSIIETTRMLKYISLLTPHPIQDT